MKPLSSQTASEIVYDVEPRQNIALARNRALSHVRSRYFAFIDDDEAASETWLQSLVDCAARYQADVVFGPVLRALPDDAPAWASDCFRVDRLETGREVEFGGAGNVLLRSDILRRVAVRFDAAFGLTGGEDTDFFYRLHLSGCKLVWCDEALASEPVAPSRLTLQWVRRRGFRGGQTYNRIFVRRYTRLRKIRWFLVKTAHLAGGLVAAPVLRLLSYPSYVALTVRIAAATGQLSACFLERGFEEYSAKRYR